MLYGYPKFQGYDLCCFRIGGTGLANLLFPWARFIAAAKQYDLVPIAPTWHQLKIGPYLRNERDKRSYYGLFNANSHQIDRWRKLFLFFRFLPTVNEQDLYAGSIRDEKSDRVVIFEGMEGLFQKIVRRHEFIKEELLKIIGERHKHSLNFDFSHSISVHVRLGDFALPPNEKNQDRGRFNIRVPISWYIDVIARLRRLAGTDTPVYIFSDGADDELSELLEMPNTRRMFFGSSLSDLLALSMARILVASGSTFSMWASYLGRMPVIWKRGQMMQRLYYDEKSSWEIQCAEGEPFPEDFSSIVGKCC